MALATSTRTDFQSLVGGEWIETGDWIDVRNPYDGELIGRVPDGDVVLVDRAVRSAHAALERDDFPLHERAGVLERASAIVAEHVEELATWICREAGKPIKQARIEAGRAAQTLRFSAVEARKLAGEMVPMEASEAGAGRLGFLLRVPLGVVAAISPFNFPLNLVAHKLGPAIAAGDPVVLKPAPATPISAVLLAEILLEAGLPPDWLHVVFGAGSTVGGALCEHPLVAGISFTGSSAVGMQIRASAPGKRVNLELGSNAPLIVDADGEWQTAADLTRVHAFSHAGQSCVSVQRIILHEDIAEPFMAHLRSNLEALHVGDPSDERTDVGPVIDERSRDRVANWIQEAVDGGGRLLHGGAVNADGTIQPTAIVEPAPDARVWCDEIFGPVVAIRVVSSFHEAIELANETRYGLHAGVFTRSLENALLAARRLEFGGVLVNDVPTVRADQQPYGGVKESGNTREGPAYAIRDLTEERFVSFRA